MTTTIDKNQWCGQFKRCNGCKLQSECMVILQRTGIRIKGE
ncbi:TPA: hypothetical protein OTQ41_003799 [Escherichia coli]|nr:antirestriction Ral family protein [Escherichia coli]EEV8755008.1 hypothetical protein [Escherichia coli]EEZ2101850.1 hypothetical protein [Escherichia coli]EFA1410136.1 hypothetical protein [Escherichia coli]MCD3877245.1 antirestriction Ral family protein [Escherichia coli]MCO4906843.1 antirestriction Ral family protein [Escherichia coli]